VHAASRDSEQLQPLFFTEDGLQGARDRLRRLKAQLRHLSLLARDESEAHGDGEEGVRFAVVQPERAALESQILELEGMLVRAEVVPARRAPATVTIGALVQVAAVKTGRRETFRVVGPAEVDPDRGHISYLSPVGQALLGREKGDTVTVRIPTGRAAYRILRIGGRAR
jgi:transcription elongation factor GreA